MDIQFYGANCVRLSDKKVSVVVDDNLASLGLKSITKPQDISIFTNDGSGVKSEKFVINGPGEYEISEVSVRGVPARAHLDADSMHSTMYSIKMQDFNIGILGHIHPDLNDEQLENLGIIDVLIIPIGGRGYTLDSDGAVELIKKIEPKIVIPTHYADQAIKYEVPQESIDVFLKAMGISSEPESANSLQLKDRDLSEKTRVLVLNRISD